jgi:membrane-associated protease RseP (regulator of RpoE activity)
VKTRLIAVLLTLTATVSLFADADADDKKRVTRTVVIRDGKVITDTGDVVLDRMLLGGKRGYIGVSLVELTGALREHYGAPKDAGVLVGSVEDNSPAAKAGLKVGDIVISVDGNDIESQMDLRRAISDKKEGDSVRIDVLRGRSRQTVVATVAEREGARLFNLGELGDLPARLGPEWRARIESAGNCGELQTRIKDLETRLKDLEKKLK